MDAVTGIITTVAGNGTASFSGDGGPASSASLKDPLSIAIDSAGNILISDFGNSRIRRVDAVTGLISTDAGNDRIRRVDNSGTITTTAGNGSYYLALGNGGPATSATVFSPTGVAVDNAGNLYVTDHTAGVRVVNLITGIISSVTSVENACCGLGDGFPVNQVTIRQPSNVAVDASGNLYIVDDFNGRIRFVDFSSPAITFASTGVSVPSTAGSSSASFTISPAGSRWQATCAAAWITSQPAVVRATARLASHFLQTIPQPPAPR